MRLVVFDFDGTLVDSNKIKQDMFYTYSRFDIGGVERMSRILKSVAGDRYAIWDAYVRERDGASYDVSTLFPIVREFSLAVNKAIAQAPEMPGASQLLKQLRKSGTKLALSSATPQEDLRSILEQRVWHDHFNWISGSPVTKVETLNQLSKTYGIAAKEIAVIGDGKDDRESAEVFGCTFYPVGDAHGAAKREKIYTLYELSGKLIPEQSKNNE